MEDVIAAVRHAAGEGRRRDRAGERAGRARRRRKNVFRLRAGCASRRSSPTACTRGASAAAAFRISGCACTSGPPHRFTGEDVVEFHCHARHPRSRAAFCGGRSPAVRGSPKRGEFTKRAFLNGKLSLSAAEGLADMINGESEAQVRAGSMLYAERLGAACARRAGAAHRTSRGDRRGDIDFPEEDIERTDLAGAGERHPRPCGRALRACGQLRHAEGRSAAASPSCWRACRTRGKARC